MFFITGQIDVEKAISVFKPGLLTINPPHQKKTPIARIPKIKGVSTRVHTTFGIY